MIYYSREKKTLIIPEGIGSMSTQDYASGFAAGKTAQKAIDDAKITPTTAITQNGTYEANYGFKEVVVNVPSGGDCQEEIAEAYESGQTVGYNSGVTAGEAAQKAKLTSVSIDRNGKFTSEDGWNDVTVNIPKEVVLGTLVQVPMPQDLYYNSYVQTFQSGGTTDGWGTIRLDMTQIINYGKNQQKELLSGLTVTENGTYTRTDGWNEVVVNVQCSGGSDCSSAITEAYQSGYSAGVADCSGVTPGELSSIYIDVAIIGGMLQAPSREITCNGYTYDTTDRRGYDLLETGHIFIVRTGTLQERYITPTSVTFTVTNSEFAEWEQKGWSINEVKFNGLVDDNISSYTGGFSYTPTSTTTEVADENHMRIIITL